MNWEAFVIAHGGGARCDHLAAVTGASEVEIDALRQRGVCNQNGAAKGFGELFALWHGRSPTDAEWPTPKRFGSARVFEWDDSELELLATLVGQFGPAQIAVMLTERLRLRTGDPSAVRTAAAVTIKTNRIGLVSADVLGGITVATAAREIGERSIVDHAIRKQQIVVRKIGRYVVIPHDEWARWKSTRQSAPEGYVRLSSLREPLGFSGDKLAEMASLGYVPTAIRVNTYGTKGRSTQFGTWHIEAKVAEKLLADRRQGLPMPWFGKPLKGNLKQTWKVLEARRHPPECEECRMIWGEAGAPMEFDDYLLRYPPLPHGAKRHLTRLWTPGLTIAEVATLVGRTAGLVRTAIANGTLAAKEFRGRTYITRTSATRWRTRRCPTGESSKSWLKMETAERLYGFSQDELQQLIRDKVFASKVGTDGAMRGCVYVLRQQCAERREKIGFPEAEAARRAGVTVAQLRVLLESLEWRKAEAIPLAVIQNVIKRLQSESGQTIAEAATELGQAETWIQDRIDDGTIRIQRSKWTPGRLYISEPMMDRLRSQISNPPAKKERFGADWVMLSEAAAITGVTTATVMKWAEEGEVERTHSIQGWRYQVASLKARARDYWPNVRFKRANPPQWYLDELDQETRGTRRHPPDGERQVATA